VPGALRRGRREMIRIREIAAPLDYDRNFLRTAAAKKLGVPPERLRAVTLKKRAVDARKKTAVCFKLTLDVAVDGEEKLLRRLQGRPDVSAVTEEPYALPAARAFRCPPVVVGLGPAGLFAAYLLALAGARPLVLERGLDVDARAEKVRRFWETGALDPDCNVQFGEGGAGTFSDGKLTTGIKDRRIGFVFETLCACGAPEDILYLAKPHVGTDRLRIVVKTLRERIAALGGTVLFGAKLTDLELRDGVLTAAVYERAGESCRAETDHLILAVGHSARDTFEMLHARGTPMEQKVFAVGVRIEHRAADIRRALYGNFADHPLLPGDYKLAVHLPGGRSVYTFCMCPGGSVVAAASEPGGVVTNGMSDHARNGQNSNSALLTNVGPGDFGSDDPLAGVRFQRELERAAFRAGGGDYRAPATTVGAFLGDGAGEPTDPVQPTYRPGVTPARVEDYLPAPLCETLREGLRVLGKKLPGFDGPEALLTGVESRSSSPVRILRGADRVSTGVRGLYPCGEGAGYAGGIVSAAVDGLRCAEAVLAENERANREI